MLKNYEGSDEVSQREVNCEIERALFEEVPYRQLTKLNIDGSVFIEESDRGKWKKAGIKENFIITHIDNLPLDNVEGHNQVLNFKNGEILIEGVYTRNEIGTYGVGR